MDRAMPFVVPREGRRGKPDRPDAVVDFFEGDVFAGERRGDKQRRARPRDTAIAADETFFGMPGVVEGWQPVRQRAVRRRIAARGCLVAQGFVRPVLVVFPDEPAEPLLLCHAIWRGRPRGVSLQHAMKLLMRSV